MDTRPLMAIGPDLKALRLRARLTQDQLADLISLSQPISQIERGQATGKGRGESQPPAPSHCSSNRKRSHFEFIQSGSTQEPMVPRAARRAGVVAAPKYPGS